MSSCTQELNGIIGTMPKAQLLCTMVLDPISERVLREVERIALLLCQKRGPPWAPALKNYVFPLGKDSEKLYVMVQRGHDQLADIILMGW